MTGSNAGFPLHQLGGVAGEGGHLTSANDSSASSSRRMSTDTPAPAPVGYASHMKVAIPRHRSSTPAKHGRRVRRACESCRFRKSKCSGEGPPCRQCRELGARCVYPPGMRERMERERVDLSKKLEESQNLLKEVEQYAPERIAQRIKALLENSDSGYVSNEISQMRFSRGTNQTETGEQRARSPSSVGSLEAVDEVDTDINISESSRAAGHIGKSSEISWMHRLQKETEQLGSDEDSTADRMSTQYGLNYHLDDLDIGVSEPVQMYWVPPRPLADKLFETYLRVAHPYLPIINRPLFQDQYRRFFDSFAIPGDKWMAILNVIFAIASNYAQAAELAWAESPREHILYLTRARMLSMSGDDLFRHPDLQQVQLEGLVAFYLTSTDQIHRAWRISALAIRSAVSLGINLKNTDQTVTGLSKEFRNRVWWSLYIIESKLGQMTGRSTCISVSMCSSPFPLPWEECELEQEAATELLDDTNLREKRINAAMASSLLPDRSSGKSVSEEDTLAARSWLRNLPVNAGLYFLFSCDLTMITQELLDRVYSSNSANERDTPLKARIESIQEKVDLWCSSLPVGLDITRISVDDQFYDAKMRLALQYYSTRILLGRPCICHLHTAEGSAVEHRDFSHNMATSALNSAMQIAALIPDGFTSGSPHRPGPWWCLLHHTMQAATVIILELSFGSVHIPGSQNYLLQLAKKCIRWLHRTSERSVASHRAWLLCDNALRRLASPMGFEVLDLPSRPFWQGQTRCDDYFGLPPSGNHAEEFDNTHRWGPHTNQDREPSMAAPFPMANSSIPPEGDLLNSSAPAGDSTSEHHHAPGSLSDDILQTFFPSFGYQFL